MGLLSTIKNLINKDNQISNEHEIYIKINQFLMDDKYLSKKDVQGFLNNLKSNIDYQKFIIFENKKNSYLKQLYKYSFKDFTNIIKIHNQQFIKNHLEKDKEYLDNVLKNSDPNICLDNEQRQVVLRDEDYTLVVAGAGAGKSTTVAAKVKYLVDIRKVNPKEILIISFTNKAVDELKERINKDLKIECPITTFHSVGYTIIKKATDEKFRIVNDGYLISVLKTFIANIFKTDKELGKKMILFFRDYIHTEYTIRSLAEMINDRENNNYESIKSRIESEDKSIINQRQYNRTTIKYERLRSIEEVRIANFLYLKGIDYSYEKPYPIPLKNSNKVYLPDFTINNDEEIIYLEHFGITEDGHHTVYTPEELEKYKYVIQLKKKTHKENNTKLIYTYSEYNDKRPTLEHLEEILIENNVKFNPLNFEEVHQKLVETNDFKAYSGLIYLLRTFINNYKTNGYTEKEFKMLYQKTKSERDKVFLEIAEKAYLYYQNNLKEIHAKDFQDLINDSAQKLNEVASLKQKLPFKYIFIDEYQDISLQRFNLTKKLSEVTDAKVIAVGDDWQSIYEFAGSKLKLFTDFENIMGYADILHITHTYRNSQELINIAGGFIQKNDSQFKKQLTSPKTLKFPIAIFTYAEEEIDEEHKTITKKMELKARALVKAIEKILRTNNKEKSSILLIGRYGFDCEMFGRTSFFEYEEHNDGTKHLIYKKHPELRIEFMTAHSSKGLGRDEVIIINAENGTYGFPSQKTNDPVLNMVIHNDTSFEDAEERRLFYVALTRTKNRVYILAPKKNPSKFLLEIMEYKENVYIDDQNVNCTIQAKITGKGLHCPNCGFPLYLRNTDVFNRKLYICRNDTEVCGFISNNLKGGNTSIKKCPECNDGYLLVKKMKEKDHYFLGCSNFDNKEHKCTHTENIKHK